MLFYAFVDDRQHYKAYHANGPNIIVNVREWAFKHYWGLTNANRNEKKTTTTYKKPQINIQTTKRWERVKKKHSAVEISPLLPLLRTLAYLFGKVCIVIQNNNKINIFLALFCVLNEWFFRKFFAGVRAHTAQSKFQFGELVRFGWVCLMHLWAFLRWKMIKPFVFDRLQSPFDLFNSSNRFCNISVCVLIYQNRNHIINSNKTESRAFGISFLYSFCLFVWNGVFSIFRFEMYLLVALFYLRT